ncbi:MAG: hypothetical protein FJ308_16350 [Planctomycetes bacterium]|nr:hypothetical protein [Planctomycetota bacterium]
MRRFEAYPSKAKLLGLFMLNIAMVAMCAFCTTLPELKAKLAGWAGIAFFGLGLVVFPRAFFRTSHPKIVMDDGGIHTGSSIGIIEWADVVAFRIDAIKGTKFISIFVDDKTKYLNRMPSLARKSAELHPHMGLSEITLCFVGLSPGLDEACYYLTEKGYNIDTA